MTTREPARRYDAICTLGLEDVLHSELEALGVNIIGRRAGAVGFEADRELAYRACFWLRSAVRVREFLVNGRVESRQDLYALTSTVDWSSMLTVADTIGVDSAVDDPRVNHSNMPTLVVKDAIVDALRRRSGRRPDVDRDNPDTPVFLSLRDGDASLYRDLGGASLHKRGYRDIESKSPLNEAIAAGLLLRAGFDATKHLVMVDPFCGSGTFLIEAAWIATDTAPGTLRSFAFERFRDRDATAISRIRNEMTRRRRTTCPVQFYGSDHHPGAIWIAKRSAQLAGVQTCTRFEELDIANYAPPETPNLVVTNPPWGLRMEEGPGLDAAWRGLGTFLRRHAQGADAWVLSGAPSVTRHLGLECAERVPLKAGPVDCRFLHYVMRTNPTATRYEPSGIVDDATSESQATTAESSDQGDSANSPHWSQDAMFASGTLSAEAQQWAQPDNQPSTNFDAAPESAPTAPEWNEPSQSE
ncbi:MAG: hypothetical protein EXS14_01195 [Planctomycetes bacterium]|nr:hypothetical protein [Planctomycetota bacterium]